jgi:hypothetical protein
VRLSGVQLMVLHVIIVGGGFEDSLRLVLYAVLQCA